MSNFFGQMVVERMGHVASLSGSLVISFFPIVIFGMFMPETMNTRGKKFSDHLSTPVEHGEYVLA